MFALDEFPSLTGVIRFLIVNADKNYIGISEFPSLTGVIRFLIAVPIYAVPSSVRKFPSLTGVIHFLIATHRN